MVGDGHGSHYLDVKSLAVRLLIVVQRARVQPSDEDGKQSGKVEKSNS